MDTSDVVNWLNRYIAAWKSGDPQEIGDLFTEDVEYHYTPYAPVVKGREAVVASWLEDADEPGTWSAHYEPELVEGNRAAAKGHSTYYEKDGSVKAEWSNLFLLTFDDAGRCSAFWDWYYKKPGEEI